MAVEVVIPMDGMPDPMPIDFPFKATNVGDSSIWVTAELVNPPSGWSNYSAQQLGELQAGVDDYFLFDTPQRSKPTTGTTEQVTLRVKFYSDSGYTNLINQDDVVFEFTYVDFEDTDEYDVVDDDTFELDTEGWQKVDELGSSSFGRDTGVSRTGTASLQHKLGTNNSSTGVYHLKKSFTIDNRAAAYIRVWLQARRGDLTPEFILEVITDAEDVVQKRVIPIAMDRSPRGGTEIFEQWLCIGAKLPTNGTYEVRLRPRCEYCHRYTNSNQYTYIYYDDIRVIETKT